MQRNHTSPFEIAHQNQPFSSKDTSCIEMFDLAMYASNKENAFKSSTQSALSKNKGSIENVNYVRYFIIFNVLVIQIEVICNKQHIKLSFYIQIDWTILIIGMIMRM